ncbi:hypothetical protein ACU4GD_33580 [Cupriavidus basilensis]
MEFGGNPRRDRAWRARLSRSECVRRQASSAQPSGAGAPTRERWTGGRSGTGAGLRRKRGDELAQPGADISPSRLRYRWRRAVYPLFARYQTRAQPELTCWRFFKKVRRASCSASSPAVLVYLRCA